MGRRCRHRHARAPERGADSRRSRLARPAGAVAGRRTVASPGAFVARRFARADRSDVGDDRGSLGPVGGYPGFSETLDTSVRGDLGDEIVMRVRAPEPAFWRGQTFTDFDGRTWTVSPDIGARSRAR